MAAEGILAEASEDADLAALTPEMLRIQIIQLRDLVTMEQASLASAREEIAKLQRLYAERCNEADNAYIAPGGEPR